MTDSQVLSGKPATLFLESVSTLRRVGDEAEGVHPGSTWTSGDWASGTARLGLYLAVTRDALRTLKREFAINPGELSQDTIKDAVEACESMQQRLANLDLVMKTACRVGTPDRELLQLAVVWPDDVSDLQTAIELFSRMFPQAALPAGDRGRIRRVK